MLRAEFFEGIPRKALVDIIARGVQVWAPYMRPMNTPGNGGNFSSSENAIRVWDGKPETMAHEIGHALTYPHRADPVLTAAYPGTDGERGFLEWMAGNFAAWVRTRQCEPVLQAWFEERYGDD